MKQYQSLRGQGIFEIITEWTLWGGAEIFQAFLGSIWIALLCMFAMFFYNYHHYYDMGINKKDKGYYLAFLDLEKVARKIAVACIMFLVGTYALTYADGFDQTLIKGSVLSIIAFPPIYMHYNDKSKYRFDLIKGD